MNSFFQNAKPIWAKDRIKEVNCSLFFKLIIEKADEYELSLSANNFYRAYLNGNQIAYGPARAAHDFYRVDNYKIQASKNNSVLVIEVSGSNCNSFYGLNSEPFLCAEVSKNKKTIYYTGKDFKCFNNDFRIRKVVRFSFQRCFSESYKIDSKSFKSFLTKKQSKLTKLKTVCLQSKTFIERNIHYPTFVDHKYSLKEFGYVTNDESIKPYEDRYMYSKSLVIFPKEEWEIDSNKVASQFVPHLSNKKKTLFKNDFVTGCNKESLTGFIRTKLIVKKHSLIYTYFDEIDSRKLGEDTIGIMFYRNTTHNVITYELEKGKYDLISFEPYTAKYIRLVVVEGEVDVKYIGIKRYENPDKDNLKFNFKNKKINKVIKAAINTFAHNAVDILTDCPSRERAGWLNDSYFSSQAEQLITGTNLVETNFLENYVHYKLDTAPINMIPCCYPADFGDPLFIMQWSLAYLIELKDYVIRTGNKDLIEQSKPNIYKLLKYYDSFSNSDELLEDLQGWRFIEWSKANDDDFVCGVNYPSNMIYYQSLCCVSELLGDEAILAKANRIKNKIIQQSFNGEFFVDNFIRDKNNNLVDTGHTTETCQYYAFYYGVATRDTFPKLFNVLRTKFGPYRDDQKVFPDVYKSNVLPGYMLRLSILNKYGFYNMVFKESIDYFYNMALKSGTLWEIDNIYCSLNHAFTSYIINIIFNANFGLIKINNEKHEILMSRKALYKDAEVKIPLSNNSFLFLKCANKKLTIDCDNEYKIKYC